jgi:hypothetical protein
MEGFDYAALKGFCATYCGKENKGVPYLVDILIDTVAPIRVKTHHSKKPHLGFLDTQIDRSILGGVFHE